MTASTNPFMPAADESQPVTMFGPDFPFAYDDWISHPSGLGSLPSDRLGDEVAIIGAGMAGDDVSFTPGWVDGAVQTALNAVWAS